MYTLMDLRIIPYPLAPFFTVMGVTTMELRGLLMGLALLPELQC